MRKRLVPIMEKYDSAYIYHYSTEKYDQLQTLEITEHKTMKDLKEEIDWAKKSCQKYPRSMAMSFLLDPVPYRTIAGIFNHEHAFWKSGTLLYQYMVLINSLPKDIYYRMSETPLNVDLLENKSDEYFTANEKTDYEQYQKEVQAYRCMVNKEKEKLHEVGEGLTALKEQINRFKGKTEYFYKKAATGNYKYYDKTLYACYVPHVQIYPATGIVQYESVSEIILA